MSLFSERREKRAKRYFLKRAFRLLCNFICIISDEEKNKQILSPTYDQSSFTTPERSPSQSISTPLESRIDSDEFVTPKKAKPTFKMPIISMSSIKRVSAKRQKNILDEISKKRLFADGCQNISKIYTPSSEPKTKMVKESSREKQHIPPPIPEDPDEASSAPETCVSNSTMMSLVSVDMSLSNMNTTQLMTLKQRVHNHIEKVANRAKAKPISGPELENLIRSEGKVFFHNSFAYLALKFGRKFCHKCSFEFSQLVQFEQHMIRCPKNIIASF